MIDFSSCIQETIQNGISQKAQKPIEMSRVLAFSCTHCPAIHPRFIDFLLSVKEKYRCNRVVHLGDLVDWHAISFHEKDPSMPSVHDEYRAAKKQVEKLHKAFPKADYLIGNHSDLPNRKAITVGLMEEQLVPFGQFWGLKGWAIHPRFSKLFIDGVQYRHGDSGKGGSVNAAYNNSLAEFCSVVQGDKHSQGGVVYHTNENHCVFGMQVGCGVKPNHRAMNYGKKYASRPILGCGVVIDGKEAYFERMNLR